MIMAYSSRSCRHFEDFAAIAGNRRIERGSLRSVTRPSEG